MLYAADFETTTDPQDCRVWAYGLSEIGNHENFKFGNTIDDLMEFCKTECNLTLYFHNEKFDGVFILYWLFKNGFKVSDEKKLYPSEFRTLISDDGKFYSIEVCFSQKNRLTILDSLKIIPFSVDGIAKAFKLKTEKLKLDYKKHRPVGYWPTLEEIRYLKHDVQIVAQALDVLFKQGLNKMTQGANALFDYKRKVGQKNFEKWFPTPDYELDMDMRQCYRGGFTYCTPKFKGKTILKGLVFDVNSLYPSVMRNKALPYGEPVLFSGKYQEDEIYNLYIQVIRCNFELKKKHIPTIQQKGFKHLEYITSSGGNDMVLYLTCVDLELFLKHYNVWNIEYLNGWMFKSTTGLFTEYIDYWSGIKIQSKKEKNWGMYTLSKLMLNALYGKFALNPNVRSKTPYLGEDDIIHYKVGEWETRSPIYIPVGAFITSWARYITITAAQSVYKRFIYADTDSLHLEGDEMPTTISISDTELGAWKKEYKFERGKFLRAKSYVEEIEITEKEYDDAFEIDEETGTKIKKENVYIKDNRYFMLHVACAGLPKRGHQEVTFENFAVGKQYAGKLKPKHVPGGIVLIEEDFTIKAS